MTVTNVNMDYSLEDRYTSRSGHIFLTGPQALVRLPLMQKWLDEQNGLNTAGFISGYRGSPLGTYDNTLWSARKHLEANAIHFQPGVNEELAAAAVLGTQQLGLDEKADHEGVFGIWYGKGPGVDRASDALKHGNAFGSSPKGGVLVVAGDDHGSVSSSYGHQSDHIMSSWRMPILHPADVGEYLTFGLLGFALSRYSGCWVGFKAISEVVESAVTVNLDQVVPEITLPKDFTPPASGLHYRWPDPFKTIEHRFEKKIEAVEAFARANPFDRTVIDNPQAKYGIATTGKTFHDVMEALRILGVDDNKATDLGLRVYKVGLVWPLEKTRALAFAKGLKDIFVIEEKRPVIETQLITLLYGYQESERPNILGKKDLTGAPLIPEIGETQPMDIAKAIASWLGLPWELMGQTPCSEVKGTNILRTPYFCSGCPHNSSTKVPEGSTAFAGVGCHFMATSMNRSTRMAIQMGSEGANWIGQAPFTKTEHIFQNLGDGTYYHSGLLAIRQACAAKVNITYKILFNDAVAMTGGQPVDGPLTPWSISQQIRHEGVETIMVVSDEPNKYPNRKLFAPGVTFHHRSEMDDVQKKLRNIKGVSALIYDQTCAAEKRRRRKKNQFPNPAKRTFINPAVCDGCGDCSEKSNCMSIHPQETPFGRKRKIDQSSCNKDFICIDGFCPSFVTIEGGDVRKKAPTSNSQIETALELIPVPEQTPLTEPYNLMVTGVGGTGVVTVGALISMAAHLEGKGASVLDFTGFAQKGGAVISHLRLVPTPDQIHAVRIPDNSAHALIAADLVVAANPEALIKVNPGKTKVVANTHVLPTGAFNLDQDLDYGAEKFISVIKQATGETSFDRLDANTLTLEQLGDSMTANILLLGYSFQKGLIPLSLPSLERAIELNGVAIETNKKAFALGRLAADKPAMFETRNQNKPSISEATIDQMSDALIAYQDADYAKVFLNIVDQVKAVEAKVSTEGKLTKSVAKSLYKLMAYKDEYEVARLYTAPEFKASLQESFEGNYKIRFYFATPLLARKDANGHPVKREIGAWILPLLETVAKLKTLRGTKLDLFGYTKERRMERELIRSYKNLVSALINGLNQDNLELAIEIASLPQEIKGFGAVKEKAMRRSQAKEKLLLATYLNPTSSPLAAE